MKREVIRVGDSVRVLRSRFIKRVGYPLVWYDIMDEVREDPKTWDAYCLLEEISSKPKEDGLFHAKLDREMMPQYFVQACAKLEVARRNFGGNERTIHYLPPRSEELHSWETNPNYDGCVLTVIKKRLAKTGKRFPSRGGVDSQGEYWDEPGGLDDCKTHVLLTLACGYEIEQCDVELARRADGNEKA